MKNSTLKSRPVAFCGVITALGVVFMLTSTIIPIFTYAAPLYTSLLLIVVVRDFGEKYGWATWAATSLLSLIIIPDKEAAFFYIFIGYYPVLKKRLDMIKSTPVRWIIKVIFVTVILTAMELILLYVLQLQSVVAAFNESSLIMNILMHVVLIAIVLFFDPIIDKMAILFKKIW